MRGIAEVVRRSVTTGSRLLLICVVFAAGLGLGVGVAGKVVRADDQNDAVSACINRYNGNVRIPRNAAPCASTEYSMTWNVEGPAGIASFETYEVEASVTSSAIGDFEASALCDAGDPVVSGGYTTPSTITDPARVLESIAVIDQDPQGWFVKAQDRSLVNDYTLSAVAVCLDITPDV